VLNSLISLADELGVVFNVLRPKSDADLIRLYNQAKAFVFAARFEPFGMVALEAMACGKPIVGVEDGGYVDCISNGVTGFITPRSPQAFGQALAKLLENPDLRMKMGFAGRERARKYWTWDRCSDDLSQFFSEMLHP
jgi:D-inositol-3-phosphate glycosyltransferase